MVQRIDQRVYADPRRIDRLWEGYLIKGGFKHTGTDAVGDYEIPDIRGFKQACVEEAAKLPNATAKTTSTKGASIHEILMAVLPHVKADNLDLEEEKAYNKVLGMVSNALSDQPSGMLQKYLDANGGDRIACRGPVLRKSGRVPGVWITITEGPAIAIWEREIKDAVKAVDSLLVFGQMLTKRQRKLGKPMVASLAVGEAQIRAALDGIKAMGALPAVSANGSSAEEDEEGEDFGEDDE
jgi:hypothetical protein